MTQLMLDDLYEYAGRRLNDVARMVSERRINPEALERLMAAVGAAVQDVRDE